MLSVAVIASVAADLAAKITGRNSAANALGTRLLLRIYRTLHLITATAATSPTEKELIRFSRAGRKSSKRLFPLGIAGFFAITLNDVSAQALSFSTLVGQARFFWPKIIKVPDLGPLFFVLSGWLLFA
ncbi:MAG: hypothetical protein RL077_746 [Verrucomicrobiota bacterium]|jgi:hypothetical protein